MAVVHRSHLRQSVRSSGRPRPCGRRPSSAACSFWRRVASTVAARPTAAVGRAALTSAAAGWAVAELRDSGYAGGGRCSSWGRRRSWGRCLSRSRSRSWGRCLDARRRVRQVHDARSAVAAQRVDPRPSARRQHGLGDAVVPAEDDHPVAAVLRCELAHLGYQVRRLVGAAGFLLRFDPAHFGMRARGSRGHEDLDLIGRTRMQCSRRGLRGGEVERGSTPEASQNIEQGQPPASSY